MKQDTVERGTWDLKIYVAGETEKSRKVVENLRKVCDEHLKGEYRIEVVDLVKNTRLAAEEQIFAVPTVIRKLPEPLKRLVGDMSATEHVLVGLDIKTKK
ncbi:MAG TPA: circadian clock KaiB family protein [Methanocella sp.]|nr:circadian clock KaiB family protein [Methanocella sp.]